MNCKDAAATAQMAGNNPARCGSQLRYFFRNIDGNFHENQI
nr:hypothetical protein [Atribacter sp.]